MGSITRVVAVLLTHMLRKPVAIMNPPMSRTGLVPTASTVSSAMRRCSPQRCIASAIINPPMKRKITSLAYGAVASAISTAPKSGKSAIGKSAVAGNGSASVIHHTAMSIPTETTATPSGVSASGPVGSVKYASTARTGPRKRPTQARTEIRSFSTASPRSGTSASSRSSLIKPPPRARIALHGKFTQPSRLTHLCFSIFTDLL